MTKYRFSDGAALVFGGSGGLGTGIVNLLAESGSDVAFTYFKNQESAEKNLNNIQKLGRDGLIGSVDLLDLQAVEKFSNEAKDKFGKIHSVIFATGPFLHIMPVLEAKPEDVYYTLDADIKGFYHVLKAVVPILKESGGGSITALTTAAIHRYISTDGLSSIPKSGVQHLCTAIAREEGHHGIRANCVAVGLIAVGLSQEIDSPSSAYSGAANSSRLAPTEAPARREITASASNPVVRAFVLLCPVLIFSSVISLTGVA